MSNLFSYVLGFMLTLPILLFGFDLLMLQSVASGLEAYATTIALKASASGLTNSLYEEVIEEGYVLVCLSACQYPQVGQTQTFVLQKSYTPLFISKGEINVSVKRTYIIGYY